MKVKSDFVTNSSSCSYIVCIPNMDKFLKELSEKIEIPETFIDSFREGGFYIYFGEEYEHEPEFEEMHAIVESLGYVLEFDECGPDNSPRYLNVAYDKNRVNQLKKILGVK